MNIDLQQLAAPLEPVLDLLANSGWGWPILAVAGALLALWLFARLLFQTEAASVPSATVDPDGSVVDSESEPGVFGDWTEGLASQIPEPQTETDEFTQILRQAGLYSPRARASIYALRFVLLFLPLLVAGTLLAIYPYEYTLQIAIGGVLAAAALSIIPRLYVYYLRTHRLREIRDGLSDMMDMLSMCLSGGLPLSEALEHVAVNLKNYPALAEELRILRRQAEVGSLKRALADFAARVDMAEVRQLASMLSRGDQLGMRLSSNLSEQADHFRSSRRQAATEQANEAPVKMVLPLLLCFAPATLIILISPTLLELRDFVMPQNGQGVLAGNNRMNPQGINDALDSLDQGGTGAVGPRGTPSGRAGGGAVRPRVDFGDRPRSSIQGQGPVTRPPFGAPRPTLTPSDG